MAKLHKLGDFVGPGEQRAAALLEQALPASWVVICNKELVNPDRSVREVDFIVVAERAVFVLEEKSWSGPIHGNENGWVLRGSESFASPLRTAEYVAKRLAGYLRGNVPMLRDRLTSHFVHPRVLLSSEQARLFVHEPRVGHVLRLDECAEQLQRDDRLQPESGSIKPFRDRSIDLLTKLANRPAIPREIRDYKVLEVLPPHNSIRAFRAQDVDGSERVLKLVPIPGTENADVRAATENALLRDYKALQALAETGRVPRVDPRFSWDQEQFWVYPVHPVPGRSLRADRSAGGPTPQQVLPAARDAFKGLAELHRAGVLHRALNPDRVHLHSDARVVFSDFLNARIVGEHTIADNPELTDTTDRYQAPECGVGLHFAEPASDVYGLAASLLHWITGQEPEEEGPAFPNPEALFAEADAVLPLSASRALARCLAEDERARPSVEDVIEALTPPPQKPQPKTELEPGELVADQYRIIRALGRGGSAVTYLADDELAGRRFVLKAIHNPELIERVRGAELKALLDLHHPNLPRVYYVRPADHPFHLCLEYVDGLPLRDLLSSRRGDRDLALRVLDDVLSALAYLGEHGILHRDVSPGNILAPEDDTLPIRLIDFGLATTGLEATSAVGTPRYRPPEVERGGSWSVAADLYSLAAVVYELLTGRLPYAIVDGVPKKSVSDRPTDAERAQFGTLLLDTLLLAASPDPRDRPQTAREMLESVHDAGLRAGGSPVAIPGEARINPQVRALRGAYRNSRVGNADNRGLDTDFAVETYVPTRLDEELLPGILNGDYRLVVLSGNPGDGKTAFIQRVRGALLRGGAQVAQEDAAGWSVINAGHTFAAVYDASESAGDRSADDLLNEALAPLAGSEPQSSLFTAIIAANDGRLLDFFERHGHRYAWLWSRLRRRIFSGHDAGDPQVALIDLKRRALVGLAPDRPSLAGGVLDQFVARERWEVCEGCVARLECPMRLNALSLRDTNLLKPVRGALHQALLVAHLRRERRATVRDLRSALAFLITHDLSCEEVHSERGAGRVPAADPTRLYFDAIFSGVGQPDLLLDEWRSLDPARVASPKLDRWLYLHRDDSHIAASTFTVAAERPAIPARFDTLPAAEAVAVLKRRYAFEAADLEHLPGPTQVLPYRHFAAFVDSLRHRDTETTKPTDGADPLLSSLLQGISRANGVPLDAARNGLALRMAEGEGVTVVKRFPTSQFQVSPPSLGDPLIEDTPDHLVLRHLPSGAQLNIGLDLFEFVMRAADGYLPGPEEQSALAEELIIYRNRLLGQATRDVILLEGAQRAWHVRAQGGTIKLEANPA
ncbi:MAG: protein kinase [Gemmatimonadetes bacterium]|nr:protein kinase [Gemmatimonadota bacterium]MBA4159113.1 protein kinase [Gemmatimonadota bacterium]